MKATIENQVNRVSKKFYAQIIERVNIAFSGLANRDDLIDDATSVINRYIDDGIIAKIDDEMVMIAFMMVKPEIDKAAERSRRARAAAAHRKAAAEANISSCVNKVEHVAEAYDSILVPKAIPSADTSGSIDDSVSEIKSNRLYDNRKSNKPTRTAMKIKQTRSHGKKSRKKIHKKRR